jgi:hypothetical protein
LSSQKFSIFIIFSIFFESLTSNLNGNIH